MTTRRQFLGLTATAAAGLVVGEAALDSYERLTWRRRFWAGWDAPPRHTVYLEDMFRLGDWVAIVPAGSMMGRGTVFRVGQGPITLDWGGRYA